MPRLNFYITTPKELTHKDFPELKLRQHTQLKALQIWLANLVKYENKEIAFSRSKTQTVDERFNPLRVGYSPVSSVWNRLRDTELIDTTLGIPRWLKDEQDQFIRPRMTTVTSTSKLIKKCKELGITKDTIKELKSPVHVRVRQVGDKSNYIPYKDTPYTKEIEKMMREYCDYLNNQKIKVGKTLLEDIHLYRTYQNRKGLPFQFGGRSGGYWMSLSAEDRKQITINGKKTSSIDMHCSQLNILYFHATGKFFDKDFDAYQIPGIDERFRPVLKKILLIMLNVSYGGVGQALSNLMRKEERDGNLSLVELYNEFKESISTIRSVVDRIIEVHKPVNHLFCLGADMGQHYAWLESNLVFQIAHQLHYHDIPCLTVHDEFIVPTEDIDTLEMLMYSTAMDEKVYKSIELRL
jgi:hypothetical protein